MQFKLILATFFATAALAVPAIEQNSALEHPKLVGRPKGPTNPSGPSCCSSTPGVCQSSCCPSGCP
ncbi:hypothetical protein CSOJ01_12764 [Colletotrichum sojae]|uniref:Uncharacterized protein n=1 Tax=Colletotrichum sojae TaxID=2175907 RepID=A0A8H6IUG7_9PEZI|nr:hypothetical protein CSOJ01_12764 [Colletotrichum sojae]